VASGLPDQVLVLVLVVGHDVDWQIGVARSAGPEIFPSRHVAVAGRAAVRRPPGRATEFQIRCSKAQADVFRALWNFEGKDRRAEDVMQRAGRRSSKPIDVFKAHPEPKRAYEVLVVTNQKEGLYRMPRAAR